MRPLLAGVASLALLLAAPAARACAGGDDDTGVWTLDRNFYSGKSGLPFLSPGNDSRINLQLLMMDAHPWSAQGPGPGDPGLDLNGSILFAQDEFNASFAPAGAPAKAEAAPAFGDGVASRCQSDAAGRASFEKAVQAESKLSDVERKSLIEARARFSVACTVELDSFSKFTDPFVGAQPSAMARDFATYLAGAQAFYDGAYDVAVEAFGKLAQSENAWLRETGRYMVGRAALNKAQAGAFSDLDGVPTPKIKDQAALVAAEAGLKAYLADYPAGLYAPSARGLLRRVFWLGADRTRLSSEYGWTVTHVAEPQANLGSADLAQEIDAKFLAASQGQSHDPNLLAAGDLMRMRGTGMTAMSAADLGAQAGDFAGREPLFAYLKAARAYYVDSDYAGALAALGPAEKLGAAQPHLAFSREMLRGQALLASGQIQPAVDHWRALLPQATRPWQKEAVELGLALAWEKAGTINKLFGGDTRISSSRIRSVLLRQSAGPILLRQAVADPQSAPAERQLARFVLLFKEATRGQYGNFLRDFSPEAIARDKQDAPAGGNYDTTRLLWDGASEPYACPDLKSVVSELAANPRAPHGQLCLGEFVRSVGLEDIEAGRPKSGVLGGGKEIFPGEVYSRGEIYKKLIADPTTPAREKAYALYRAVNCYATVGHNTCGGTDVEPAQRKAWFRTLKTQYGATPWAQELKYFW